MILKEKNGLSFFQFPNLAECSGIRHGIFTRSGGCSKGPFQSLNVSFGIGDEEEAIHRNRLLISKCMDDRKLVFINQVHGTEVLEIRHSEFEMRNADAMITDVRDIIPVIQVGDCQAVLLCDPEKHVVANVHSGWRGSISNIIGHTVSAMRTGMGCNPRHMLAGIGPSLGPCCAEFINYKREIPEKFWKYKDESNHFDFWKISTDQLCEAGVPMENICSGGLCSKCSTDLFFSYRGERITGRFAAIIGLC